MHAIQSNSGLIMTIPTLSYYSQAGTFYQTRSTLMSLVRRPHKTVLWVPAQRLHTLNDSSGSSHIRIDSQT